MRGLRPSALFLASLLAACTTREQPPEEAGGEEIYRLQVCRNCHGEAGAGKPGWGPPLFEVGEHWTRLELAKYLADPDAFKGTVPRLIELDQEYSTNMNPYANLSLEQRLELADYLLGL